MKRYALAALLLALVVVGYAKDKNSDKDGDGSSKLDGTYLIMSVEHRGQKVTADDLAKAGITEEKRKVTIKGDTVTVRMRGMEEISKIKLDTSKTPYTIDSTEKDETGKLVTHYGIYKLEGDTLTFCLGESEDSKDRPREFKASNKNLVMVLKKQK